MNNTPLLSAIVVVGPCRRRSQRVVTALCTQTVAHSIEIIIVDLAPAGTAKLETLPDVRVTYLSRPETPLWSRGRWEGLRHASAPIVAFIEDHCFPAAGWAEALIDAHKSPWAAVGYAFTNANPETYLSRACMINDYGLWLHPVRPGAVDLLPGQNVSYKRHLLLSFGDQLESLLTPDFGLYEEFRRQGLALYQEPRALVAHENFTQLSGFINAHYAYSRLLSARRVQVQSWTRLKCIFYGLAVLPGAPALYAVSLFSTLRGRNSVWPTVIASLPVCVLTRLWAAVGESLGYLLGPGTSEQDLHRWEIETERSITR